MLTNLAYFKLLKSLPDDTLSNVNSQLVLLAAAGALNKADSTAPQGTSVSDLLASDLLKQQGLLECLAAQLPTAPLDIPLIYRRSPSPTRTSTSAQASTAAVTSVPPSPERNSSPPANHMICHVADHVTPDKNSSADQITSDFPQQSSDKGPFRAISTSPVAGVKEEPKSPKSPQKLQSSPKASFRPVVNKAASPSTCVSSTVHWGNTSSGPPPNKTCTSTTTTSISKLHPCDTSILNLLNNYTPSTSAESSLQKSFLQNCESSTSTASPNLTNINWSSTGSLNLAGGGSRRSYNCYWMSHVGPCNRQFRDKDDLYKHLKTHVNDLEALTPATAILQPLNPPCPNCDLGRSSFAKVHGRFQPYSKCSKFSRCSCRR